MQNFCEIDVLSWVRILVTVGPFLAMIIFREADEMIIPQIAMIIAYLMRTKEERPTTSKLVGTLDSHSTLEHRQQSTHL